MDARAEAKRLYLEEHLSAAEIAERLNISVNTVRSWKMRDVWCNATQRNAIDATRAREIKPGTAPFEPKNQKATIHGLFARYLPDETRDIVQQIQDRGPIDVLWDQIQLAYAALIRAQKIMHVTDIADETTSKIGDSTSQYGGSETWQVQYAWDKQASFLKAQAQAQSALAKMIMQYDELCRSELTTEEQRIRIDKLKSDMDVNKRRLEIDLIKAENAAGASGDDAQDDNFIQALAGEVAEVWADGSDED